MCQYGYKFIGIPTFYLFIFLLVYNIKRCLFYGKVLVVYQITMIQKI